MAKDCKNNVMGKNDYKRVKEEKKRKLQAKRKGKLKGLGYEFILFLGTTIVLIILWIMFTYVGDMFFPMLTSISTHASTITRIDQISSILYFSLFGLVLLGAIWVYKTTHGRGAVE